MTRISEEALETALVQLSEFAPVKTRSNWLAVYLAAARMKAKEYPFTADGANHAVDDAFVLVPNVANGRVNPFISLKSKVRWLKNSGSGRMTVWNTSTRGNAQSVLFNDGHIGNGLRDDALDVLLAELRDDASDAPLPARDAVATLLVRDVEWPKEPDPRDVHQAAADFIGLSLADFDRLTSDHSLGVPFLGQPEWSADALQQWEYGPRQQKRNVELGTADASASEISAEEIGALPIAFEEFLALHGIASSMAEIRDLLAATLSGQLIIMAGPSGSGKSLMASALAAFFAKKDRRTRLEASRFLARQEEFLGYYSQLAGKQFIAQPALLDLLSLDAAEAEESPIVTIEEANLSPIEGYLSALVHGLGATEANTLDFKLHALADPAPTMTDTVLVPPTLSLAPYPRFFATINVDADSPAPARKVVSRACVVLMETPSIEATIASSDILVQPSVHEADGPAAGVLGSPGLAFQRYADSGGADYQQSFAARAAELRDAVGGDVVNQRSLQKSLFYIAWFVELGGEVDSDEETTAVRIAVDNALLHFVLPTLPAHQFSATIEKLPNIHPESLLASRVDRLKSALDAQSFGPSPDFWGALS